MFVNYKLVDWMIVSNCLPMHARERILTNRSLWKKNYVTLHTGGGERVQNTINKWRKGVGWKRGLNLTKKIISYFLNGHLYLYVKLCLEFFSKYFYSKMIPLLRMTEGVEEKRRSKWSFFLTWLLICIKCERRGQYFRLSRLVIKVHVSLARRLVL